MRVTLKKMQENESKHSGSKSCSDSSYSSTSLSTIDSDQSDLYAQIFSLLTNDITDDSMPVSSPSPPDQNVFPPISDSLKAALIKQKRLDLYYRTATMLQTYCLPHEDLLSMFFQEDDGNGNDGEHDQSDTKTGSGGENNGGFSPEEIAFTITKLFHSSQRQLSKPQRERLPIFGKEILDDQHDRDQQRSTDEDENNKASNSISSSPSTIAADEGLRIVANLIRKSNRILVLSGAGVSVSCGIPDFRSPGGLYDTVQEKYGLDDPQALFDIVQFRIDPQPFYTFCRNLFPPLHEDNENLGKKPQQQHTMEKLNALSPQDNVSQQNETAHSNIDPHLSGENNSKANGKRSNQHQTMSNQSDQKLKFETLTPSLTHRFIRKLEQSNKLLRNYTQNIDGIEILAGIEKHITCHGSLATATCQKCGLKVKGDQIWPDIIQERIPYCSVCTGQKKKKRKKEIGSDDSDNDDDDDGFAQPIFKPDIIFFGERLHEDFFAHIENDIREADLVLVVGTSLQVAPVATIPIKMEPNVPQILINRESVNRWRIAFDAELLGDCDTIVDILCKNLEWDLHCPSSPKPDAHVSFERPNKMIFTQNEANPAGNDSK